MARKTKEDALETRNQLLDAAEKVFFDKGFSRSSLAGVASAAGVTRGAVYWHFKNKADLFAALIERVRLPVEALGDCCAADTDPDPLGRLREFAKLALQETVASERRRRVFTILFHKFEFNDEVRAVELRQQAAFMDCMRRIERSLENAVKLGQLPEDLDVNTCAIAYHAYFTGLLANWLFMPRSFALEDHADALVDGFFCMLQQSTAMRSKARPAELKNSVPVSS